MVTQNAHAEIADAQEREAMKRVPKTGPFNEISIPILSMGTFGFLGYHIGKWVGKLGDDTGMNPERGRFEAGLRVLFSAGFGLLAAAVSIRQTREAKSQAVELAKRSLELEQHNAALASVVTKPVGTLIETFDKAEAFSPAPLVDVSEAHVEGTVGQREKVASL